MSSLQRKRRYKRISRRKYWETSRDQAVRENRNAIIFFNLVRWLGIASLPTLLVAIVHVSRIIEISDIPQVVLLFVGILALGVVLSIITFVHDLIT